MIKKLGSKLFFDKNMAILVYVYERFETFTLLRAPFRGIGGVHKQFGDFILENTMQ
jgi:hypothetical protein